MTVDIKTADLAAVHTSITGPAPGSHSNVIPTLRGTYELVMTAPADEMAIILDAFRAR